MSDLPGTDVIISHQHRYIFFAVPRTATHTIREALRGHLAEGDWEQKLLFGETRIPIPEIAALKHGHITCRQLKACISGDIWDGYLKFGFVRNPFDRFISTCFFLNRQNPGFRGREITFMKQALGKPAFRQRVLVIPQAEILADESGQSGMDYIGRYESLQESFDEICRRIGIPPTALDRKNASIHSDYMNYYDAELREMVEDFYRRDLEMFGYEWASNPNS